MAQTLPRDIRISLGLAAASLGLVGISATVIGGIIALRGETVPAYIGFVITAVLGTLAQYGKWVLDYQRNLPLDPVEELHKP